MRATTTVPTPTLSATNHRLLLLSLAAILPLAQLLALAAAPRDYSYFIDEFYYIACARHLAFGYVDHPPLAPAALALTRTFLGDSMVAIRLLPFLAGGATVWLVGRLVQELGGGRFAIVLACLAFGLAPVTFGMTSFFSMNAFEPLLWTALMLAVVRIIKTGNSRLWLLVGVLAGLSFENKHTVVAYLLALAVGVVLSGTRRALRDPSLWAGVGIAAAIALPNVLWQVANGWPSLEFYRNAQFMKNLPTPPLKSLWALTQVMNPLTLPMVVAGLGSLLFARVYRDIRFAGLMFVALLAMHVASQTSRPDRMLAAFPIVLAAGAIAAEGVIRRRVLRVATVCVLVVSGGALALVSVPLLPPATEARYVAALGIQNSAERGKTSPIPQLLADRTGWQSFIDDVERVYRQLTPEEQRDAIIYVPDYGHAGAIELLGKPRGLPRVISGHNTYWHWSDGHVDAPVIIAVRPGEKTMRALYRDVRRADTVRCEYCMSWRGNMPIFVGRDPVAPVQSVWAQARSYE